MSKQDTIAHDKLRVLIADDVQATRRNTRLMLAEHPMVDVVAIARNGEEAVKLARKHMPDIAIMDINMPKMDGLSAYQAMTDFHPNMACIIISAEKGDETLREAMTIGAREYLLKPFTVEEIIMAVNRVGKTVFEFRKRVAQDDQVRKEREKYLKQLAHEYAKSRRVDNEALGIFEQLATNPKCELHWLMNLALANLIRRKWGKLKDLVARLEQQTSKPVQPDQKL
ncbi:MAG: response regulator transcription factor [Anaerolineales bacterium]|nr:response regulator transcription factor [Anaerolineales bacterium]